MSKNMNIPKLRFSEFSGEWEEKRIGECIELLTDYHANGSYEKLKENVELLDTPNFAIMIRTTNFEQNDFIKNLIFITEDAYDYLKKSKVYEDDIIINKIANAGATYIMPKIEQPVSLGMNIFLLRAKSAINKKFLFSKIKWEEYRLKALSSGTSTKTITKDDVRSFKLNLPSKPEQEKIASFLTSVDTKIEQLTKKEILLQEYKKGVMSKIFSQEIKFKNDDGIEFPEWKKKRLEDVFYSEKGKGISKNQVVENGRNECILYGELYTQYNEVIFGIVSKTNFEDGIKSEIGDLLIPSSTTTTGIDLANITALNKANVLLGGDITVLRSKEPTNNIFYAYYLTNFKKNEIASYAQGSTIVHLYYNLIKDMLIDFPYIEEQTKIANFLSSIDKKIDLTAKELNYTKEFKKALLQQIFV